MSLATVLARGRAAAEALMVDACLIREITGESTGPGGVVTPTYATVYEGKCRIQQPDAQARQEDSGQAYLLMSRRQLQLPMAVTGVRADQVVTITASVNDPDLTGRVFVVRDEAAKTHATSRRVGIEERTS
jgi:hypothetical protein